MVSVPTVLDGAEVLAFADLAKARRTGRTRHVVNGVPRDDFAYVALAK